MLAKSSFRIVIFLLPIFIVLGMMHMAGNGFAAGGFLPSFDSLLGYFQSAPDGYQEVNDLVSVWGSKWVDVENAFGSIDDIGSFFRAFGSFFEWFGNGLMQVFRFLFLIPRYVIWFFVDGWRVIVSA